MSETILDHIAYLRKFIPTGQISCIIDVIGGEEGQFFRDKLAEIHELIRYYMPRTYEADGQGDDAMVYLHYFKRGGDWYITERDKMEPQHQAFGFCNPMGDMQCAELGYVSIVELLQNNVELDLYWDPITLGELKSKKLNAG